MGASNSSLPADVEERGGKPTLLGSSCPDCGEPSFPARERCPACRSPDQADLAFDREATVESYTVIHTPGGCFEPPYVASFVRLSPGDIRVFAPLFEGTAEDLSIGASVEFQVGETGDDEPIWGFVPQDGGGE